MRGVTVYCDPPYENTGFLLTRLMRGVTAAAISFPTADKEFLLTRLMRGVTV